jgi:hypothetical protein
VRYLVKPVKLAVMRFEIALAISPCEFRPGEKLWIATNFNHDQFPRTQTRSAMSHASVQDTSV